MEVEDSESFKTTITAIYDWYKESGQSVDESFRMDFEYPEIKEYDLCLMFISKKTA